MTDNSNPNTSLPPSTPTPGLDYITVSSTEPVTSGTKTVDSSEPKVIITKNKFSLSLLDSLLIVLVVTLILHYSLTPRPTKPTKIIEPKKVAEVVKKEAVLVTVPKDTKNETVKKSKSEVKAERRHKKGDHSYSGPMSN